MSLLKQLLDYSPAPPVQSSNQEYEALLESIEDLYERWSLFGSQDEKEPAKRLSDPTQRLSMARIHTVMLSPADKGFALKDKVFGIRNEDPIVSFMLSILGIPMDGTAVRIRTGFMQYDERSKMLFIARFKTDLPGERNKPTSPE